MVASTGKQTYSIPIAKVVSFPFVQMKQGVKNPFNLGQIDLELRPELWWDHLLDQKGTEVNKFVTDTIYEEVVIFLLGLYSMTSNSEIFSEAGFCSGYAEDFSSSTINRYLWRFLNFLLPRQLHFTLHLDNLFFLNPGQLQVMKCQANKQLIMGESKTGKTFLLMERAFHLLMEGESIYFLIPKGSRNDYKHLLRIRSEHNEDSFKFFSHGTITRDSLEQLQHSTVIIDDLQNFFSPDGGISDQRGLNQGFRTYEGNSECTSLDLCELLRKVPKAVVASTPISSFEYPVPDYEQLLLNSGYQLLRLREQYATLKEWK